MNKPGNSIFKLSSRQLLRCYQKHLQIALTSLPEKKKFDLKYEKPGAGGKQHPGISTPGMRLLPGRPGHAPASRLSRCQQGTPGEAPGRDRGAPPSHTHPTLPLPRLAGLPPAALSGPPGGPNPAAPLRPNGRLPPPRPPRPLTGAG